MRSYARLAVLLTLLVMIAAACTYTLEPRFEAAAAEIIEVEVAENGFRRRRMVRFWNDLVSDHDV